MAEKGRKWEEGERKRGTEGCEEKSRGTRKKDETKGK